MANKKGASVALLIGLLVDTLGFSKTIYFGATPETVPILYGAPTVLRFEEPVKTISNATKFSIKPVNEEDPDYSLLSIEPRELNGKTDVVFMLASGELARLRLSVLPSGARIKTDSIYDIRSKQSLIETKRESTPHVNQIDLMSSIIRGDQVTGYDISAPYREVGGGFKSAKVILKQVYRGEEFRGFVYEIRNLMTRSELDIDIRKLRFGSPNQAILAFSDLRRLGKMGHKNDKTRLIVITKPFVSSSEAVLPFQVISNEKSGGDKND